MSRVASQELPPVAIGQIKIDLSVKAYEIDEGRVDGKRTIRKLKYPGLSAVISVLEKTGAKVRRVAVKGRFTVIDYMA